MNNRRRTLGRVKYKVLRQTERRKDPSVRFINNTVLRFNVSDGVAEDEFIYFPKKGVELKKLEIYDYE